MKRFVDLAEQLCKEQEEAAARKERHDQWDAEQKRKADIKQREEDQRKRVEEENEKWRKWEEKTNPIFNLGFLGIVIGALFGFYWQYSTPERKSWDWLGWLLNPIGYIIISAIIGGFLFAFVALLWQGFKETDT
jgi:uncharacterized membrane protein YcjF (UPF0283 family)